MNTKHRAQLCVKFCICIRYIKRFATLCKSNFKCNTMRNEYFIIRENKILKQLLLDGFFYMNYSSRDCDGCYSENSQKFTSIEQFYTEEENCAEWSDGSFSFSLAHRLDDGSFDLIEPFNGGQW